MSKPNYKLFVPFLLRWEGGYVNDPVDRGGETNMGITRGTFDSLAREVLGITPTDTAFRNMTKTQAELFIKYYWDKATYNNSINDQAVAEGFTSWFWGSGRFGLKELQRNINREFGFRMVEDGLIGPQTIRIVNSIPADTLIARMIEWRKQFFMDLVDRLPSQSRFINGWLNRLEDFADRHKKKLSSGRELLCSDCPFSEDGSIKDQE